VKRSLLVEAAVCSVLVIGCSRTPATWTPPPPDPSAKPVTRSTPKWNTTPEGMMGHAEGDDERAQLLRKWAKDPKFDPKQHKEMLEQYAKSSDTDLAAAAKELADKAQ
jgi:hypothetical protein